jgi:hypothetical protein
LHGALTLALGERKIDVLPKDANTPPAPVFVTRFRPFAIACPVNDHT